MLRLELIRIPVPAVKMKTQNMNKETKSARQRRAGPASHEQKGRQQCRQRRKHDGR